MMTIYSMISILAAASKAATIAELIAERKSTMGRADAAIGSHPEWSQPGAITLFVSTDAGFAGSNLPSGSLGSLQVAQSIDFLRTQNYQILQDVKSTNIMVYDNYAGGKAVPEIHCRFGTGEAMANQQIKADNGWLYILDKPIEPPGLADVAIRSIGQRSGQGTGQFLAVAKDLGLTDVINSLKESTLWIPVDAAFASFDSTRYTQDQLKAIILYHVTPRVLYSVALNSGPIPSSLEGQSINVGVGNEAITLNGNGRVVAADTFATSGVIHLINQVLVPQAFPAVVTVPTVPPPPKSSGGTSTSPPGTVTQPPQNAAFAEGPLYGIFLVSLLYLMH